MTQMMNIRESCIPTATGRIFSSRDSEDNYMPISRLCTSYIHAYQYIYIKKHNKYAYLFIHSFIHFYFINDDESLLLELLSLLSACS